MFYLLLLDCFFSILILGTALYVKQPPTILKIPGTTLVQ